MVRCTACDLELPAKFYADQIEKAKERWIEQFSEDDS